MPVASESPEEIQFDVVDIRTWDLSTQEIYLLSSLEGLINTDDYQLFIINNNDIEQWMQDLNNTAYNATILNINSLEQFIDAFSHRFEEIIIWDDLPESANIATPLVKIYNSTLVHQDLYGTIKSWSGFASKSISVNLTQLYNAQGFDSGSTYAEIYKWAFDTFYTSCSQEALGMIDSNYADVIRSQLCAEGIFTFFQPMYCEETNTDPRDSVKDLEVFEYIIENSPQNIVVYGYMYPAGCNEHPVVSRLSAQGKYLIPTDYFHHMPFWKHLPIPTNYEFNQTQSRELGSITLENKLYVAGIFSDGDNLQYVSNYMKSGLWDNQHGAVPTTYEMSPSIFEIAPAMAMVYYEQMSINDYFVNGVGGKGYVKSDYASEQYFTDFWEDTRDLMIQLDQRELRTWDSGDTSEIINLMKDDQDNLQVDSIIEGYFGSREYKPYLVDDVPFMRMRVFSGDDGEGIQNEREMLNALLANLKDSPEFITLHLHCWSTTYEDWQEFVELMEEESGGQIVFVTSGQLSQLMLQANLGEPNNTAQIIALISGIIGAICVGVFYTTPAVRSRIEHQNKEACINILDGLGIIAGFISIIAFNDAIYSISDLLVGDSIIPYFYGEGWLQMLAFLGIIAGIALKISLKRMIPIKKEKLNLIISIGIVAICGGLAFGLGYFHQLIPALIILFLGITILMKSLAKSIIEIITGLIGVLGNKDQN